MYENLTFETQNWSSKTQFRSLN